MFEDEDATLLEYSTIHDNVGDIGNVFQLIRRICKDDIELLVTAREILEHITANGNAIFVAQLLQKALYEAMMEAVLLNADHLAATTREKLKRNATCTRKEIESHGFFVPVNISIKDVKHVLLGEIGRRTCFKRAWHIKMTTFVFTCNNAQLE